MTPRESSLSLVTAISYCTDSAFDRKALEIFIYLTIKCFRASTD